MKKMRHGEEFLSRKNPVLNIAVCLIILIVSRCGGSFDEVEVCEYQDALIKWSDIPTDVIDRVVYKGDNLVVAWSKERGFTEGPSYKGRLKQEGESILIIKANQSDSGTYKLSYISPATYNSSSVNLEVMVPPTNQCIPNITLESNALKPKLPPNICGVPMVTSRWKHLPDNIIVHNFESGLVPGTYTACANGKSLHCFKGDVDRLCSNYTIPEIQPQNQSSSMLVGIVAAIIFHAVLIVTIAIVLVCLKKEYIRGNLFKPMREATVKNDLNEGMALMRVETSEKDVQAIKRHLINQYRTMTAVSLSPCYEENFEDVSKVYCDLDIISLGENVEGIEYINPTVASYKDILGGDDMNVDIAENVWPIPAMILGECGSGKSSWCKNLVNKCVSIMTIMK